MSIVDYTFLNIFKFFMYIYGKGVNFTERERNFDREKCQYKRKKCQKTRTTNGIIGPVNLLKMKMGE